MLFSIIIPTKDRPALAARAVQSVRNQTCRDLELIVVNDGSSPSHQPEYAELARLVEPMGSFHDLTPGSGGSGPSAVRNYGVARARGAYVGFLDDDDEWIDPDHLARAAASIGQHALPVDLLLSNQEAVTHDGTRLTRTIWIEDLEPRLAGRLTPDPNGAYAVSLSDLLGCAGFAHLNVTLVRRELFQAIGGFDPDLRYEEDRDFQLQAMDVAETILFNPKFVSRHHVPQPLAQSSQSTSLSSERRVFSQLRLLDKLIVHARHEPLRKYAERHKAYTLKRFARGFAEKGDLDRAAFYAAEALGIGFGAKWLAYVAYLSVRRRLRGAPAPAHPAQGKSASTEPDRP